MRVSVKKEQLVNRRAFLVGAGKFAFISVLAARLYYLQVVEKEKFTTLAEGNRIKISPIIPARGRIFDINGKILADGVARFQVRLDVGDAKKKSPEIVQKLGEILEQTPEKIDSVLKSLPKNLKRGEILIEDFLTWEQVAKVEEASYLLPGVYIANSEVRHYTHAEDTANIIGYIGTVAKDEVHKKLYYRDPAFRIGKSGLERELEDILQGTPGLRQVEINSGGIHVRQLKEQPPTSGTDVKTTINIDLQLFIMSLLKGKGGKKTEGATAVVLDIHTGGVLALASVPSYDPNRFVKGIDKTYWNELINNVDAPLNAKAITMQSPPGSTFKMVTALAGLKAGVISESSQVFCPGHTEAGGRRFHCWNRKGHGSLAVRDAIAQSCNVFFYTVAKRLGIDPIAEMAKTLGLGAKTGIELPHEKSGLIPSTEWKRKKFKQDWYMGETFNAGIGQGYTQTTPLQLAVMSARIASGGKKILPHIVYKENISFDDLDISAAHLDIVQQGMERVVTDARGTMFRHKLGFEEFEYAGKTGTTQVVGDRSFKSMPSDRSNYYHALFVGFAPLINPKYAISVVIEHGGFGSSVAGPIAKEIFAKLKDL